MDSSPYRSLPFFSHISPHSNVNYSKINHSRLVCGDSSESVLYSDPHGPIVLNGVTFRFLPVPLAGRLCVKPDLDISIGAGQPTAQFIHVGSGHVSDVEHAIHPRSKKG